jgi:hypothetical protein
VGHIYGRCNLLNETVRPNMFVSELKMYIDYLGNQIGDTVLGIIERKMSYFQEFRANLDDGILFYHQMVPFLVEYTQEYRDQMVRELVALKDELELMVLGHPTFFESHAVGT